MQEARFNDIVASIYRTIEDPQQWAEVLHAVAHEVGGDKGVLYSQGVRKEDGGLWVVSNIEASSIDRYAAHYGQIDAWRTTAEAKGLLDGSIRTGDEVLPRAELYRTEWYNDFAHPLGLDNLVHFVQPVRMNGLEPVLHFSIFTDQARPEFDRDTVRRLARFQPHLKQALLLRAMLDERLRDASARALVGAIHDPALLVDRALAIRAANKQAEALLREGVYLRTEKGVLAPAPSGTILLAALQRLFAAGGQAVPCTVAAPVREGEACFYNITPVSLGRPQDGPWDHALVVLRMPSARALDLAALRSAYGLTAAEVRIAAALAAGDQVRDIGEKWNLSRETVRTHVKRVLHKTGCARQGDLVRLVWSVFPPR